jgi:signal transduction histidine kinase/ligand-binding sensor domain-containing protein
VAKVWQTEQGLPQNSVNAMLQDREGYIWIGTFGGLARFDGERFKVFTSADAPGFISARIYSLYESRSGMLWVGTVDGGLTRLQDGVAVTYTERDGLPSGFVRSVGEDAAGNTWISTSRGVARFVGGKLTTYATHRGKPVVQFYLQERDGSMWFRTGSNEREITRFGADGSIASITVEKAGWLRLHQDGNGSVWIAVPEEYRLIRCQKGVFSEVKLPQLQRKVTGEFPVMAMAEDANQRLIVLTPVGLLRISDGKVSAPIALPKPLLESEEIKMRSLLVDREGNLWLGTLGAGLVRFRPAPLTAYGQPEGLSDSSFSAVFQDREGRIWLGGDALYQFDGERFRSIPKVRNTRAIAQTRDGDLWFGGYGGVHRWRAGVLTHFDVRAPAVRSIYQDRQGTLWIGALTENDPGGLYRFREGTLEQVFPDITDVRDIHEDGSGSLWVGGLQGLWHIRDGKTVLYNRKQGMSQEDVADIYEDSAGTLWIATYGGGLHRFREGKFRPITTKDGLPNNMIVHIEPDGKGNLWLSSNQDIFRLSLKELNDYADGRIASILPVSYGIAEGMRSSECNGGSPAGWRTADGRLWFPTLRGVVAIDPAAANALPPPVEVEEARAGQLALTQDGSTTVPPDSSTFDFRFTALSFSAPEKVRFQYRLEPYQQNWIDAGTRRTAHFTNMAPGKYVFRVIAANNDGVWNTQGAAVQFVLRPHFYQTIWFRALGLVLILGLVWAVHLLRVRHLHRQFEMTLDARVGERTRIARELHDTLLQSFHGLLLRFQTVSHLLPERPTEAKERLDSAIDQAAEAITEGRDAVQGLRASTLQSNDLALAISTMGEELAIDSTGHPKAALQVAVEGQARNLHPIVRDEVYRIAAEAMRNAFRHAEPRRVEVEIRYAIAEFRMRVRDDGKGMSPAALAGQGAEGHYGLRGIRERATLIGGKLEVWSQAGEGTELELRVPASAAYAGGARGSRWAERLLGKHGIGDRS